MVNDDNEKNNEENDKVKNKSKIDYSKTSWNLTKSYIKVMMNGKMN